MSCQTNYSQRGARRNEAEESSFHSQSFREKIHSESFRKKCGQVIACWIFIIWILGICVRVSHLWIQDMPESYTKHHRLERMSGNDGKFWKGNPDGGIYDGREGIECREYYHYKYNLRGKLSKTEYYRHHEYYEDVWCQSDTTHYQYDLQGRIARKRVGQEQWIYKYTKDGHTETRKSGDSKRQDTYTYDAAGNLTFSRLEIRYAQGHEHETTISYDEQNRRVQETLKIGNGPAYVSLTEDYDEENHTGLIQEYNSKGGVLCIGLSTYDEEWREIGNIWFDLTQMSENEAAENLSQYKNVGYWADYRDGRLMEELSNRWNSNDGNGGWYEAYDYDKDGNCIWDINVFGKGMIYMTRYEYDGQGRMTDQYNYNCSGVETWEQLRSDGNRLTIDNDMEDDSLRITTTAPDGTLINQFVYEKGQILQYTPEGEACWYRR